MEDSCKIFPCVRSRSGTHDFLLFSIWESSLTWCSSHGGVLFRSPSNTEAAGRNAVSWQFPAAAPLGSITTAELWPDFSHTVPNQWLSTTSRPGHSDQCRIYWRASFVLELNIGLVKTFSELCCNLKFSLLGHPSFPSLFIRVRPALWFEGSPCLLLLSLPSVIHRAHPQ